MTKLKPTFLAFVLLISCLMSFPGHSEDPLAPKTFVRKVKIHGGHPYLKSKILRFSSIQPGDVFHESKLAETDLRLTEFFLRDGYLNTEVDVIARPDKKQGFVNIDIRIHRGSFHRIGDIALEGNVHMDSRRIRNKIGQQSRYSPLKVKQKLRKIEHKYVNKGFVRTRIKLESAKLDPADNRVDLSLNIKERKRFFLDFTGNSWFRDDTLKSQTTFYKERTYDREAILRSRMRLLDFYHLNGFLAAEISATIETTEELVRVSFDVKEGPRTRLKSIVLDGTKQLDDDEALKGFKSQTHTLTRQGFYQEGPIEEDLKTLVKNYHNNGYFDVLIHSHQTSINTYGDQATLLITLSEGEQYEIGDIRFTGLKSIDEKKLLDRLNLKTGRDYDGEKISKGRARILKFIQGLGYPLVSLQTEELIQNDSKKVDLVFEVDEGPQVKVGRIVLEGLYATRPRVVTGALQFKEGDLFRYDDLLKAQFNLKRMDLFDHVSLTPVNLTGETTVVDILVSVKERKRLTLDIQTGFDSDKLGNGELLLTRRNVFGLGKHVQLRAQGGFELSRGELTFISPRLFDASWNLVNQYFIQYEDDENFNAFSYGGSIGVLKNFGRDWTLLLKTQVSRFDIDEANSNEIALQKNLFDNTFAEIIASVAYDTRDSYGDPTKGLYAVVSGELDTDLSDVTNDFLIFKASASHYLTLLRSVTLSNTVRAGDITVLTDHTRIPATKLFFMGGNDTVRGFNEDAINESGGTTRLIYNSELAFRVHKNVHLAGFFDIGSLSNGLGAITQDTFRQSAGFGLRYITPVGPIRLDYGFILDRKEGEQLGRFHFTFGYFF